MSFTSLMIQQFGQAQVIPLRVNMRVSEISFGPNFEVPRSREILHEWNNILTIDIGNESDREIPKYQVWLREDRNSMSPEGEQGFEDIGMTIWIRHSHLGTKVVTSEMWAQMETIMLYLDNAGAGPSNVGASSSLLPPALFSLRCTILLEGRFAKMSGKSVNAPIPPIALVSDEETEESMF
ncbi:hypothetical protein H5410_059996 [Solanum commersonii]|uniref:Uncharacterized protein n=1 Tax=Solanum commersonii TaxID=4109 RepID=A0A9J5W572_SOLCO|nr:hypothetical protein H5410_059996 [Solanum commersonii]